MSQYHFTHNSFDVLYGWDDPLQYNFLVIENILNSGEEPIFSNLNLDNPGMSISQIQTILVNFEIPCPGDLIKNLKNDAKHSRANYKPSKFQQLVRNLSVKSKGGCEK